MNNALNRYLEQPDDDGFTDFCETIYNHIDDFVYEHMEANDFENSETENEWLAKLFDKLEYSDVEEDGTPVVKGMPVKELAAILERAYRIFLYKETVTD